MYLASVLLYVRRYGTYNYARVGQDEAAWSVGDSAREVCGRIVVRTLQPILVVFSGCVPLQACH